MPCGRLLFTNCAVVARRLHRITRMSDAPMPCETCGAQYRRPLTIELDGKQHTFDCFECAIHALAPPCSHCKCRVIGHGVEANGAIFCCQHCADSFATTSATA